MQAPAEKERTWYLHIAVPFLLKWYSDQQKGNIQSCELIAELTVLTLFQSRAKLDGSNGVMEHNEVSEMLPTKQ